MDDKVQLKVCSSIVQGPDGAFAVVIHWPDGTVICGPAGSYATEDEAREAGSKIITIVLAKLRGCGYDARRPGDPPPEVN